MSTYDARRPSSLALLISTSLLSACSLQRPTATSPMVPAVGRLDTLASIRWTRSSAEHDALFREVYRAAESELERRVTGNRPTRPWGVIVDVDETMLDNSPYEQERAVLGKTFDAVSWDAWVRSERAAALPGAVEFTQHVHSLGGRVVVVTNRLENQCDATRGNLSRVHLDADRVLCAPPNVSDKNPRFEAVGDSLQVEMWVGDNIQDFPKLRQTVKGGGDGGYANFGGAFFLLPNPMYGSWSNAPLP